MGAQIRPGFLQHVLPASTLLALFAVTGEAVSSAWMGSWWRTDNYGILSHCLSVLNLLMLRGRLIV
ncbi:hypothetical protein HOY82DRAFT_546951 [Tuber indicum]|nr:hypothetical protein HOY82DRAFT_546951 [Tuber indicum]